MHANVHSSIIYNSQDMEATCVYKQMSRLKRRDLNTHIHTVENSTALSCSATSSFVTPRTAVHQAPLSMGFSRQEYWKGVLFPPPGHLPNPDIKPRSPSLQADSLPSEPPGKPKNTGVGRLSLLQGIFLTQDSNWALSCTAGRFSTS